jgi:hypothetical protein
MTRALSFFCKKEKFGAMTWPKTIGGVQLDQAAIGKTAPPPALHHFNEVDKALCAEFLEICAPLRSLFERGVTHAS